MISSNMSWSNGWLLNSFIVILRFICVFNSYWEFTLKGTWKHLKTWNTKYYLICFIVGLFNATALNGDFHTYIFMLSHVSLGSQDLEPGWSLGRLYLSRLPIFICVTWELVQWLFVAPKNCMTPDTKRKKVCMRWKS